jgi:NADH-quinone oxidoreductase subunit I
MIFGLGALKGMMVTLKNFVTSYYKKPNEGGIFTIQYPEERAPQFELTRNFPFLVYDETPDSPRCVACGICERECPTKCIHIVMAKDAAGKPARKPAVFDIDYGLCMNCGMCEEVCPFDSIYMDHEFEITAANRLTELHKNKEALLKPDSYFRKVRPTEAAAVDAKRKAAEEKKKAAAQAQAAAPSTPPQGPVKP